MKALQGITNLLGSKKGFAAGVLAIGATVLVITGHMTVPAWQDYTMWIFGIYAGAETANGVAASITTRATKTPQAETAKAPE